MAEIDKEREERYLAQLTNFHRKKLLAYGEHGILVHTEDLPIDYKPGMKLIEMPDGSIDEGREELLTGDNDDAKRFRAAIANIILLYINGAQSADHTAQIVLMHVAKELFPKDELKGFDF